MTIDHKPGPIMRRAEGLGNGYLAPDASYGALLGAGPLFIHVYAV